HLLPKIIVTKAVSRAGWLSDGVERFRSHSIREQCTIGYLLGAGGSSKSLIQFVRRNQRIVHPAGVMEVARPRVTTLVVCDARPDGIQLDIPTARQQVPICVYDGRAEASLP